MTDIIRIMKIVITIEITIAIAITTVITIVIAMLITKTIAKAITFARLIISFFKHSSGKTIRYIDAIKLYRLGIMQKIDYTVF